MLSEMRSGVSYTEERMVPRIDILLVGWIIKDTVPSVWFRKPCGSHFQLIKLS